MRASEVSADRALIEQKSKLAHELKLEKRLLLGFRTSNGQIIEGQIATLSQDIATLSDINVTAIASELLAEVGRMGERALIAIVMKKVATAVQPAPLAAATELTRAQRILAYGTNALNGYQVVTGLLGGPLSTRARLLDALEHPGGSALGHIADSVENETNLFRDQSQAHGLELVMKIRSTIRAFQLAESAVRYEGQQELGDIETRAANRQWWEFFTFVRAQDEGDYVRALLAQKQALMRIQELELGYVLKSLRQLHL